MTPPRDAPCRRGGGHLQPAAAAPAPGGAPGRDGRAERGPGGRQRLDRRHRRTGSPGSRRRGRPRCWRAPWSTTRGGAGGFHDGLALGGRPRRRPGVADGRRRPARRRLPRPRCSRTTTTTTSGARWSSTRTTRRGCASRSGCPAAPGSSHDLADVARAARRRRARGRRHPVQRRAGHPRARGADRPAPRGVLHLGRRRRVPLAGRARPAPASPPWSAPGCCTPRRRARDADDVGPHDVQPQPRATSSTTAWPATTWSTCATTAARCTRWPSW